jgi:hypothetical protein
LRRVFIVQAVLVTPAAIAGVILTAELILTKLYRRRTRERVNECSGDFSPTTGCFLGSAEFFVNYHELTGKEYKILGAKGPGRTGNLLQRQMKH